MTLSAVSLLYHFVILEAVKHVSTGGQSLQWGAGGGLLLDSSVKEEKSPGSRPLCRRVNAVRVAARCSVITSNTRQGSGDTRAAASLLMTLQVSQRPVRHWLTSLRCQSSAPFIQRLQSDITDQSEQNASPSARCWLMNIKAAH